ncbi:hypothetical protein G7Y79_00015g037870 [Physcia stellaris]|nr:hypothetical protein G7Y79_00015g037870 [Physcia stellaris]
MFRPPNSSTLGAPSEFEIEYSIALDYGPTMNEIAIYMTAINALEDLCFRDQSSTIPGYPPVPFHSVTTWSLPQYAVYCEISSQQVRYAIWGLQMITGDVRRGGFWPVVGRYYWRDRFAGRVDLANKAFPLPPEDGTASIKGQVFVNGTGAAEKNSTTADVLSHIFPDSVKDENVLQAGRLRIFPRYNGVPLTARAVFGTAIDVMVLGAENGVDTYCIRLQRAEVEIVGVVDAAGEPLLRYKSVIRAMSMLMSWMVAMNRFGEVEVEIRRYALLIGKVRIKKRVHATGSSDL